MDIDVKHLEALIDILTDETSLYGIRRKLEYEQRAYNAKHYLSKLISSEECDCALHKLWESKYGARN